MIPNRLAPPMKPPEYDEQAAQKEFDKLTSLSSSIYWLKAIVEQGARVFDAAAQPVVHSNSASHNSRSGMEEQFFLTAGEKAQRWIKPMELDTPEAKQFSELGKAINIVRSEREHDDERFGLGNQYEPADVHEHAKSGHVLKRPEHSGGKLKQWPKFRMEKAATVGGVTSVNSMSVTVHSGGHIRLGGIVDVAHVVSAAEALLATLLEEHNAYWEDRLTRGWKSDEKTARVVESYRIEPRFRH